MAAPAAKSDDQWAARTTLTLTVEAMNIPSSTPYLVAAVICGDLHLQSSEVVGLCNVSANEMGRVHFQPSIEFPLEFASRQQICVRLYSATTKDKQPAVTSIEDRMAALSPNMFADMVVPVMEMLRDASIEPDAFDPALQTGFKRPLRTVVPGVSDEAPSISIQWREVHHNTRVVNLLLSAALVGNRFTCVDRALKTRVRTRLQVLRQHGGTDADKTWRRIVDTDPVAGFEPSWFIERIAEDEITPDPGDSLCVKLWRDAGASRLLLGDAFVRRRAVVKLFTELEARQRGSLTGATKASGQRMSIFDATEKMTPSTLSIKLRSPSDETQVAADVTLEIARINRAFTIFEYITAGMMLDLTIAIDAHAPGVGTGLARAANANPCLMALDPIVHLLAPHCSRICPIGFNGALPDEPGNGGFFQFRVPGADSSGLVGTWDDLVDAYGATMAAVERGRERNAAPLVDCAVQGVRPMTGESQAYAVLIIVTGGAFGDMAAFRTAVSEASTRPLSVVIIGIPPTKLSPAEFDAFRKLVDAPAQDGDARSIVQFTTAAIESQGELQRQSRGIMVELEAQILAFMIQNRIKPLLVKPLLDRPTPVEPPSRPAATGSLGRAAIADQMRSPVSRAPSLSRQRSDSDRMTLPGQNPTTDATTDVRVQATGSAHHESEDSRRESRVSFHEGPPPPLSSIRKPSMRDDSTSTNETNASRKKTLRHASDEGGSSEAAFPDNASQASARTNATTATVAMMAKNGTEMRDAVDRKLAADAREWRHKSSALLDTLLQSNVAYQAVVRARKQRYIPPKVVERKTIADKAREAVAAAAVASTSSQPDNER
ncbi:Copine C-terminal domain-containing protein [Plasmodiophora brassicae]|uniref:Copine C-terminal domain-containing protein n=2 Tax=Plasmodiophora brassicae TaxID=37360 RepID=A0A3P3YAU5_PLABS|nr:unnamed protein product [Plasmodiophora brassicae]